MKNSIIRFQTLVQLFNFYFTDCKYEVEAMTETIYLNAKYDGSYKEFNINPKGIDFAITNKEELNEILLNTYSNETIDMINKMASLGQHFYEMQYDCENCDEYVDSLNNKKLLKIYEKGKSKIYVKCLTSSILDYQLNCDLIKSFLSDSRFGKIKWN